MQSPLPLTSISLSADPKRDGGMLLTPAIGVQLVGLGALLATVIIGLLFFLLDKPDPAPIVL